MKKHFLFLLTCTPFLFCFHATSAKATEVGSHPENIEESSAHPLAYDLQVYSEPEEVAVVPEKVPANPSVEVQDSPSQELISPPPISSDNLGTENVIIDYGGEDGFELPGVASNENNDVRPQISAGVNRDGVETAAEISENLLAEASDTPAIEPDDSKIAEGSSGEGNDEEDVIASDPEGEPIDSYNNVAARPAPYVPSAPLPYVPPAPIPSYTPPAPPVEIARSYEQLEVQLPGEIVEQAQREEIQIIAGISEAVESAIIEGNIKPERVTTPEKDNEKLVYKVELEDISFLCGEEGETPATVAKLKGQDELIVVLWDSDFFAKAGYDPQTRCEQASARFADFAKKKELALTYMTSGKLNGQSVICLTDSKDGGCGEGIPLHEGLLFTLKPKENPESKLKQLASIFQAEPASEPEKPLKEDDKTPVNSQKKEDDKEPLKE